MRKEALDVGHSGVSCDVEVFGFDSQHGIAHTAAGQIGGETRSAERFNNRSGVAFFGAHL